MTSNRKSRMHVWLTRARSDLDRLALEVESFVDPAESEDEQAVAAELEEVRSRMDALENRVEAIERSEE